MQNQNAHLFTGKIGTLIEPIIRGPPNAGAGNQAQAIDKTCPNTFWRTIDDGGHVDVVGK
jgi:hypothetical protein